MITLTNGHRFKYCCAAGALGYDGSGYWWEAPFRWVGLLRPEEFTIITKTVTLHPRLGNYRWWKPWKTVKIKKRFVINSMGLPNPGIDSWIASYYPPKYPNVILSVFTDSVEEVIPLCRRINTLTNIRAVQLNVSCPNAKHGETNDIIDEFLAQSEKPVILKIGYQDDYINTLRYFHHKLAAVEAINTIPWKLISDDRSPLYPLVGGISGPMLRYFALQALSEIKHHFKNLPVISGGGIYTQDDIYERFDQGANAIAIGTLFLRKPWKPNRIIK